MSRAWRIHDYSSYKGFVLEEETLVEPGEGEIRLKVEAFALNWGDMDLMKDNYSFSFRSFPAWVGIEAASVIEAVRLGVEGLSPGERVATLPTSTTTAGRVRNRWSQTSATSQRRRRISRRWNAPLSGCGI